MEDTNRIRTKLRLDLNDISRQIEDLEELMKKEKTTDRIEHHRKLVEYEKKLKEQYEKMTGLNIKQASALKGAKKTIDKKPSKFARFSGILSGFAFAYAYFNLLMHGISGFSINDFINYFMGTGKGVSNIGSIINGGILSGNSYYIVIGTLTVPVVLTIIESLASNARSEVFSVLEGLALTLPTVYLIFTFAIPHADNAMINGMFNFTVLLALSGVSIFFSGFGGGFMNKLMGTVTGGLFGYAAYQAYMISIASDVETQLVQNWPFLFLPLMLVGGGMMVAYTLGFIKD